MFVTDDILFDAFFYVRVRILYVLLPAMSAHDANNDLVILDMVAGVWRNLARLVIHVLVCTSWSPSIPLGSFLFVDSDWPVRQLGV